MILSIQEVEHIATLSRLKLSEAEKQRFAAQLSSILEYAARLQALDTAEISPTFSVLPQQNRLRADEPRPGLEIDALMANAPDTQDRQFRVPPVFE